MRGSPADRPLLAEARAQILRLEMLVRNVLEMARLAAGGAPPEAQIVDLVDVVTDALSELPPDEAEMVELAFPSGLPMVCVDPRMLRHMLGNLVSNALRHGRGPKGVTVRVDLNAEGLAMRVMDRGPGLGTDSAALFGRPDAGTFPQPQGGTGLGLAIVKGFADAMGLTVTAANQAEGGGLFYDPVSNLNPMVSGMTQQKILIVDDELAIRRLISATLMRSGFQPVEADSARAALSLAAIEKPAVVLLDLGLPDRDGLELIGPLSRDGECPVLVISARDQTVERVAALDLGADDYVTKPFDTDELLARLRAALRRSGKMAPQHMIHALGAVRIDLAARQVWKGVEEIRLTPKEWSFLAALAANAGRVLTHRHLLHMIWGPAHEDDLVYLRVAARALRQKLEDDPARPKLIRNEPAIGYRLMV